MAQPGSKSDRPLNCRIDSTLPVAWMISRNVVTLTIKGRGDGDLRKAIAEAMSDSRFPANPAVLLDSRRTTENPTADQLRIRAGWIATVLSQSAGSRCALVIGPKPYQYGLARMLSVFLGTEGIHAEIFHTVREARRWLTPANGRKRHSGSAA